MHAQDRNIFLHNLLKKLIMYCSSA